jgi:hypothetical protein
MDVINDAGQPLFSLRVTSMCMTFVSPGLQIWSKVFSERNGVILYLLGISPGSWGHLNNRDKSDHLSGIA